MAALPAVLRDLGLYALLILAFLGPVEAFLRFRLRQATHREGMHPYLALADPWVTVIVALAGTAATVLVSALS